MRIIAGSASSRPVSLQQQATTIFSSAISHVVVAAAAVATGTAALRAAASYCITRPLSLSPRCRNSAPSHIRPRRRRRRCPDKMQTGPVGVMRAWHRHALSNFQFHRNNSIRSCIGDSMPLAATNHCTTTDDTTATLIVAFTPHLLPTFSHYMYFFKSRLQ